MAFSIQTNVNSLIAQENLRVNTNFQSQTIQRLTSGYRINSSGDDAAGLAVANKFRSDTAELAQGVRNANDGISALQIIDGGMNNVSKMLDRLRTLAAQSASDTFQGNRAVLNDEFQSLLGEIDRQAQAIGLNTGGQFAKSLSVFVGGGKTAAGGVDLDNGSVAVNLAASTVDTKSLGLKGMQVVGNTGVDLGGSQSANNVSAILAAGNSTSVANQTDFYFSGAGFSDNSKIKVSVNLQGVTDTASLVTAINSAIQQAGAGGTQAATEFKNAGIVASVHTDGATQQLAFTSTTAAFQVEAGDQMANAFLGNVTDGLGTAVTTSVAGATITGASGDAFTPGNVHVRISGAGLNAPVDLDFEAASTTLGAAVTDLTNKVSTNAALQAAGITMTGDVGSALTFTSAKGEKLSVVVTGDTAGQLGLGSFTAGTQVGSKVDYSTITATANYDPTAAYGSAVLEFSLNGAASNGNAVTVNLNAGTATAGQAVGTVAGATTIADTQTLTLTVDGGVARTVNFTVADNSTAGKAVGTAVAVGGDGDLDTEHLIFRVDGSVVDRDVTFSGATATLTSVVNQINTASIAGGWGAHAYVDGDGHLAIESNATGASSGVEVRANSTANVLTALGLTAQVNNGTDAFITVGEAATQISAQGAAWGIAAGVDADGYLTITSATTGASSDVNITGGTAQAALGLAVQHNAGESRDIDDLVNALNTGFAADAELQKAGMVASKSGSAITISSNNGTFFRVNAGPSGDDADIGFGSTGASFTSNLTATNSKFAVLASQGASKTDAVSFAGLQYGNDDQSITISANDANGSLKSITIALHNDTTGSNPLTGTRNGRDIDQTISYINAQLQASNDSTLKQIVAVKERSGNSEQIAFMSALSSFSVGVGAAGNTGDGLNSGGAEKVTGGLYGAGSNVSIDTQSNGRQAVAAIAGALTVLGSAQAAVGKGQNQLNYAVGLAQSQINNFSAAESRIRDADVASEAANLTKAQVLQQASMAAMAQANSAPQAVLALLRG